MPRLLTLQATRGVAANLVVLSHLSIVEHKYTHGGVLPSFTFYGVAGVDLFFVLSGFIMVAVAGRGVGPWKFLWRRAARIYPTYWLVTAVVLAITLVAPDMVNSSITGPISVWRSFLLVPARTPPMLAVGWTLIHEMYFYLVFAVFLALRIPVLFGLIAWGVVLLIVMTTIPNETAAFPVLSLVMNPLTAEFMMGATVGLLWVRRRTPGAVIVGGIGAAALAFSVVYVAPVLSLSASAYLDAWRVLIFGVPSALVLYALSAAEHRTKPPQRQRLLAAIGDWSYATYLVHVLVISAIGRVLALVVPAGGTGASLILISVGIVTANVAGAVIHLLFERPTLNWLHQLGLPMRLPKMGGQKTIQQSI